MEEGTQLWMRCRGWCEGGAGVCRLRKGAQPWTRAINEAQVVCGWDLMG